MKKLIIWDFDGVIADTEKLWVSVWQKNINENFGLDWNFEKAYQNLAGISIKTKLERLSKIGIVVDEKLLNKITDEEIEIMHKEMSLTDGIVSIFENEKFRQCIATGGIRTKTALKLKILNLEKHFSDKDVFTSDMVEHGKPEPDLFLFAAKQMGYKLEECIVIEDSIAGITAAIKANIDLVVFAEHQMIDKDYFINKIKELGVNKIAYNAQELKEFLQ